MRLWLIKTLQRTLYGDPDFSIMKGDIVVTKHWPFSVEVVDVNWDIRAAAVRLIPGDSIVVWPVASLHKF